MQKNQQKPIPAVRDHDGLELQVHSIFKTIQGEGPFGGRNAIFVRMSDCNLQCPLCDTEYTGGESIPFKLLAERVAIQALGTDAICVITGGEPLRQNLSLLVRELNYVHNIHVQIETNGATLSSEGAYESLISAAGVTVVCSPKTRKLHPYLAPRVHAYKYVIDANSQHMADGLPIKALDNHVANGHTIARPPKGWQGPVYVQPMDVQDEVENKRHRIAAKNAVMNYVEHEGRFRVLIMQIHKEFNLE